MAESETEVIQEREGAEGLSLRDKLGQYLDASETQVQPDPEPTPNEPEEEVSETAEPVVERAPLVPPADMNKAEKEAFLNPTPENAYILQQYLNRRAYETRSDYTRRMQEVEQMRRRTAAIEDVIKEHEQYYVKRGVPLQDVARRTLLWDQAMATNPVETALDWLDAYGVKLDDLVGYSQEQPQTQSQPPSENYLTKEDAERIAQERLESYFQEQEKKSVAFLNQQIVTSFMNNKPLFRDPETAMQLEAEMAPVVQALSSTGKYANAEEVLETAYNYVVNGNPLFSGLVQKMAAKPVIEQQVAVTQKAKAASKTISGSAGSGTPRLKITDLRDNLRRRLAGD